MEVLQQNLLIFIFSIHLMIKTSMNLILKKNKSQTGYSLVEMLIYISMLIILLVAIIQGVIMLSSSYINIKAVRSIENSAFTAINRLENDIRSSTSIDTSTSTFGVNPGMLKLNIGTSTTVRFYLSNQRLYVEENGSNTGPLTFANVRVTSLVFRNITTTNSSAIKIEMTLQSSSTAGILNKNFYMTTVLRGSYQ